VIALRRESGEAFPQLYRFTFTCTYSNDRTSNSQCDWIIQQGRPIVPASNGAGALGLPKRATRDGRPTMATMTGLHESGPGALRVQRLGDDLHA
jgi:hypothetical protein